ncbi:hypothetical protein F5X96DRAFT_56423 [Biscogniauxia mediterranea]|nr:hypothetical protein F5X96DRAFT_56423 [Biscogniauxia mediterranea]
MAPLRMPVFFELTRKEKRLFRDDVVLLLRKCEMILANDRFEISIVDYAEAFRHVRDALLLANDPDACESAPLARCNLYKGHILHGLRRYPEARDAYLAASKAKPTDSLDAVCSRTATRLVSVMDRKILEKKRAAGIWEMSGGGNFRASTAQLFESDVRDPRLKKIGLGTEFWDPEPASISRIRTVVSRKRG